MAALKELIDQAQAMVDSRGEVPGPRAYELAVALVELNQLAEQLLNGLAGATFRAIRDGTFHDGSKPQPGDGDGQQKKSVSHRWSGWPGAWCLDCGCEDKNEIALADGADPETLKDQNGPCPEPGSNRFNPYAKNAYKSA